MNIYLYLIFTFFFGIGCQSNTPKTDTSSPKWWNALTPTQKEYYAEVYRIGIGVAYWQCLSAELERKNRLERELAFDEYNEMKKRLRELNLTIQDRIRLAQSFASYEQNQWLVAFSQLLKNSISDSILNSEPIDSIYFLKYKSVFPRVDFVPNRQVNLWVDSSESSYNLWSISYNPPDQIDSLWFYPRVLKEPYEVRNPMAKLLQSYWKFPMDTGLQQSVRWEKMVLTRFDHPNWQLGNLQKKTKR